MGKPKGWPYWLLIYAQACALIWFIPGFYYAPTIAWAGMWISLGFMIGAFLPSAFLLWKQTSKFATIAFGANAVNALVQIGMLIWCRIVRNSFTIQYQGVRLILFVALVIGIASAVCTW